MTTTAEAIGLPFEEAIDYFRQKVRVPTEHWDDLWKEAHARGFMVAGATSEGLLKDFQQAIQKALSHGTTLAEFRKEFDRIVKTHGWQHTGEPGWRAQIIYETNLSMAYSAGRYAQQTDPDTLRHFPYWQYRHSGSRHPRLMHLAWDGLTLKADDPWWDAHYPPNGWHCGCRVSIVSEGGLRRMGKTGPDASPGTLTKPWTNPRTGETKQVAVGCDPGFDYNPGKAWKEGRAAELPVKAPDLRPAQPPGAPVQPGPVSPRHFATLDEAHRTLAQAYQPWADALSADEATALDAYKGAAGRRINEALRTGRTSPFDGDVVALLQTALARTSAPFPLRVMRGVSAEEAALYRSRGEGAKIAVPAFVSTTLAAEVALRLAQDGEVIEIMVPQGMPGVAYIHPFPRYRYRQYEVLLPNGTTFRVVRADEERIVLEVAHDNE